jgi:4-hydroxyacetophenone monooxygenase
LASGVVNEPEMLRVALADADPVILLMVYAQLTGDLAPLDEARAHIRFAKEQQPDDIPQSITRNVRERLSQLFAEGAPRERSLSDDQYAKMVSTCVGDDVPANYLPMLLGIAGIKQQTKPEIAKAPKDFRVLIIGAGLSGIAMAVYLKKAGVDFLVVERGNEVGGVWAANNYPGCGVDTASHFYSYSFAQNPDWSRYFALQPEIRDYIADCVERFGIASHLRLATNVSSARFDDKRQLWDVTLAGASGEEIVTASAVVSAVGQLSEPFYPEVKGLASFKGPVLHTGAWRGGLDYAGKRVALIGTGASSVQVGPTIAPDVQRLLVFQRSAQWFNSRTGYHRAVTDAQRWALRHIPGYSKWFRLRLAWQFGDLVWPALFVDASPADGVAISRANDALRRQWTAYMQERLQGRPDLLKKALPSYPPLTKRPPVDNGWFEMLRRDNVELITEAIKEITAHTIVTADGAAQDVDAIILATGFQASRMLKSIQVFGRDGQDIRALWSEDDPRAYLGITVPGFPNFFIMYGPNTNLGHGGNIIFHAECQANYIVSGLKRLFETKHQVFEVKSNVFAAFNDTLDDRLAQTVWSTPGISSSFKNSKGKVRSVSPWRLEEYWRMTRELDPRDYSWD